jgi:uncharacterized membrane protein
LSPEAGKWMILAGLLILVAGLVLYFFYPWLQWLGRLPGDIRIEKENFRFYFPITTMILISILLNLLWKLWQYLLR